VDTGKKKTTKGTGRGALLSLDKQKKRDFKAFYQGTVGDAYANIQRDNEKADYLNKLLMA